jgi:two-component system, NarL family, response regulator DegU
MLQEIKVLIVDGHPVVRQVLKLQIELVQGFSVIADADTTSEAITLIRELKPDVVLIDTDMPGLDGIAITKDLHLSFPRVPLLILGLTDDEETCLKAFDAGAAGFIRKSANTTELIDTIRHLALSTK